MKSQCCYLKNRKLQHLVQLDERKTEDQKTSDSVRRILFPSTFNGTVFFSIILIIYKSQQFKGTDSEFKLLIFSIYLMQTFIEIRLSMTQINLNSFSINSS